MNTNTLAPSPEVGATPEWATHEWAIPRLWFPETQCYYHKARVSTTPFIDGVHFETATTLEAYIKLNEVVVTSLGVQEKWTSGKWGLPPTKFVQITGQGRVGLLTFTFKGHAPVSRLKELRLCGSITSPKWDHRLKAIGFNNPVVAYQLKIS